MNEVTVNQYVNDRLTVIDSSGNRVTGLLLGDFTHKVRDPSGLDVTASVSVSLVEIGDGVYIFKFLPNSEGVWTAWIDHATYGKWDNAYRVTSIETDITDILPKIDAIKTVTDNLPDSGALTTLITHLTDIKGAGWTNENLTVLDSLIDSIKAVTDNLPDSGALTTLITHLTDIKGVGWTDENLTTMDSIIDSIAGYTDTMETDLKTYMDTKESNIRGSDSDTLKSLSDQIDLTATETNATANTNTITTAIATTESNIRGTDSDDLKSISDQIDPLATEANATTNRTTLETAISTAESNIRGIDSDDLKSISDQIDLTATEANATANTNTITGAITTAHTGTDAKIDTANTHLTDIKGVGWLNETLVSIKSAIDSVSGDTSGMEANLKAYMDVIEDNIRGASDNDLKDIYDYLVTTKSDLTIEINENEGKIDVIDILVDSIVAKMPTNYVMGSSSQGDMNTVINDIDTKVDSLDVDMSTVTEQVERMIVGKEAYKITSITRNSRGKPLTVEWETYTDDTHTIVRNRYRAVTTYTPLGFIDTHEVTRIA